MNASPLYSPETVLVLRALNTFESLYLSRSSNRLNEAISQAFANGARGPPGQTEGVNIARAVANELDSAKFDPLLVKAVARHASSSLENLVSRADNLVSLDHDVSFTPAVTSIPILDLKGSEHCQSFRTHGDDTTDAERADCDVLVALLDSS